MEGKNYKEFSIPEYGIKFQYPGRWMHFIEMKNTYLFRDEEAGTFRISPYFSATFNEEGFLQKQFDEDKANAVDPSWKTYNNRLYKYHDEISRGNNIKVHSYVTTAKNRVVIVTFEHELDMLDNEISKAKVSDALEEVEKLLSSLTIGK